MQASPDLADLVPQLTWGEGAIFLGYLAAGILAPGWGLVRLARLESDCRYERWALTAVLGTLWSAWLAFGLGLLERPDWHPWLVGIPLVAGLLDAWRRGSRVSRRSDSRATWRSDAPGLILVAAFAGYYLARVAAGVELDNQGLRLYGAWWSDKMTNLSPAFALLHKVPPPSLRMAGEFMPYHYFEHLFVATVARAAGIDVVRGFWFYASATGVAITGLAVVAFARRRCGPRLAWLGLVWFGLMRFGTETKAMDLSLAMLFLALLALDRAGKREGARWGALAVVLIGIMPAYEAYHAMAACLGLVLWWTAALLQLLRRGQKRGSPSLPEQPGEGCAPNRAGRFFRTDLGFRTGVTFASGLLALLVIQVLYLGMRTGSPVVFRIENSYRESYKHEWFNAARGNDAFSARVKTLLLWKRGELPDPAERARLGNPRPSHLQHIAGTIVYEFGFVIYFLLRFVNVAIFGILALALSAWRRESWSPSRSLIAAIALVGFAMPCVVIWGHMGGGKWWGTPDIYRLTGCGHLLLMLEGLGLLCIALRQAWRPRWWLPLGLAGYQAWVLVAAVLEPVTGYHHVSYDRLGALAYLRQHVRFGEVVIHPWIDDLIYDSRDPHRAPWIYKRHFNLVSNMTGQMMYYEGREDAMFVGAPPEAVYRRSNLRQAFYQQPDAATLAAVLEEQPIRWVVADGEHRAPPAVCAGWEIVYRNATVRIYRR